MFLIQKRVYIFLCILCFFNTSNAEIKKFAYYDRQELFDEKAMFFANKINTWNIDNILEYIPFYLEDGTPYPAEWNQITKEEFEEFKNALIKELNSAKNACGKHLKIIELKHDWHLYGIAEYHPKEYNLVPYWVKSEYENGVASLYMEVLEYNNIFYLPVSFNLRENTCNKNSNQSLKHGTAQSAP
jgi:hypothetical protein